MELSQLTPFRHRRMVTILEVHGEAQEEEETEEEADNKNPDQYVKFVERLGI